jgi:hypothetical protein
MTREESENKQMILTNYLIDLNNKINTTWTYHPENPNRIDPVMYHAILVEKANKVKVEIDKLIEKHGSI